MCEIRDPENVQMKGLRYIQQRHGYSTVEHSQCHDVSVRGGMAQLHGFGMWRRTPD